MAQGQVPFHLTPPPPLKLTENKADEWKMFKQLYENYAIITDLEKKDKAYQKAILLHTMGPEGVRIFNTITFEEAEKDDVSIIMKKMSEVLIGETNETYERYVFNKRDQRSGESIEAYSAALKELAKTCNFCDCMKDSLIRDRIVLGITDNATKKILLQRRKLKLQDAIDICKSSEATAAQMQAIGEEPSVHRVDKPQNKHSSQKTVSHDKKHYNKPFLRCKFCGGKHILKKELCPAYGKECRKCKGKNHFAHCCKAKQSAKKVKALDETTSTSSETESVSVIEETNSLSTNKGVYAEMLVDNKSVKFQIDSGASVNVIPEKYVGKAEISKEEVTLRAYNGSSVKAVGRSKVVCRNPKNNKKYRVNFVVVKEDWLTPLFSGRAAEQMKLLTVNYDNFVSVNSIADKDILTEFQDVFGDRPGKLPGKVQLVIETDGTRPVQCNAKPVPVALKEKVKNGLQELVDQDVLIKVDKPTDWASRLVVTQKKDGDELRFCIDPRPLNKVLKREVHRLPIIEDILPELSKAKVFSKFDLKSGYLHCELDEQSSLLTTMNTPFGRYRWKRLPFGLKVSSEIFQKKLQQALEGLEGIECVADDIIVFGVGDTKEDAEANHDTRLKALLQRCREQGITLNRKKSVVKTTSMTFLGHVVTDHGLKPDPKKVQAILELPTPTNSAEVQRLQGSVNYLARFLPALSDTFEPLRKLTRKDAEWQWETEHDEAIAKLKELLTSAPVLAYYSPDKSLTIQCDASKSGLGAALLQEGQPLCYASRALTSTEQRYAQIEKEALAIVFALERFHQYTYGQKVIVESDHKPLEVIIKKPLHRAPRRLQGMMMRMLHYDIDIKWVQGKNMHLADMLSRAYLPDTTGSMIPTEVNSIEALSLGEDKVKRLQTHTKDDQTLEIVKTVIQQGWPEERSKTPEAALPYFNIRDELSIQDGLVLRGERIVIPVTLRKEMKETLHTSHLGIEGTLRRARECIYWPGMNQEIKQFISMCETCRSYEQQNQKETLMPHELPDRPWEKVGTDLFELDGKHYLITVDYLSNFWEIDRLYDLTSKAVISKLKNHFARYGIPNTVVSDNGPQFASDDFAKFTRKWEFEHYTISPRHSQANGKVESAVKSAKRLLQKSAHSKTDPYLAMLELRNTPTQGVESSPAQRLHGRRTRTTLPTSAKLLKPRGSEILNEERKKMKKVQDKQSKYYNQHAKDLPVLHEGDVVRLKPYRQGTRVWQRAVVQRRLDERSYEVETDTGLLLRRNRVDMRRTDEPPQGESVARQKELPKPNLVAQSHDTCQSGHNHKTLDRTNDTRTEHRNDKDTPQSNTQNEQRNTYQRTRSGRIVKPPQRYGDFVKK